MLGGGDAVVVELEWLWMQTWVNKKRWAWRADLKRCICRSHRRFDWCDISTLLFVYLLCRYGLQFKAAFLKASPPTTLDGIKRYIGSGIICGIGPIHAKKLVGAFGIRAPKPTGADLLINGGFMAA